MIYRVTKRYLTCIGLSACLVSSPAMAWEEYENRLLDIIGNIKSGQSDDALNEVRDLVSQKPTSRLGNLIYADLMAAQAASLTLPGSLAPDPEQEALSGLRHELKSRWSRHTENTDRIATRVPARILKASRTSRNIVYADLTESRLYVYENRNGKLNLVDDYFVTQGLKGAHKRKEGDQKTPVGVYYTTGFISGATLPSKYGPGALPINYPNPIDRQYSRTGYGIWIHGTEPYLLNRAPQASDGCLSLNNEDFLDVNRSLHRYRHVPVIIDDNPRWLSPEQLVRRKSEMINTLHAWKEAWESRDADSLFSFYDPRRFNTADDDFENWARKKELVLAIHENLKLTIRDIELFEYPGEQNVVMADFEQELESDEFSSTIRKQQYWRQSDNGEWKVIFEGLSQKNPPRSTIAGNATKKSSSSS